MKLEDLQKVVQAKLDAELEDAQRGGVAISSAPGQSELNGFVMGVNSTRYNKNDELIEVPEYFRKYFE